MFTSGVFCRAVGAEAAPTEYIWQKFSDSQNFPTGMSNVLHEMPTLLQLCFFWKKQVLSVRAESEWGDFHDESVENIG